MKKQVFQSQSNINNYLSIQEVFNESIFDESQNKTVSKKIVTSFDKTHFILNASFLFIVLIFGLGFIVNEMSKIYVDVFSLGIGVILIGIFIYCFYNLLSNKIYRIEGNLIFTRSMMESDFHLIGEIKGFGCKNYISKYSLGEILLIKIVQGEDVIIDSSPYKNYEEIKKYCQLEFSELGKQVFKKGTQKRFFYLTILILASIPLLYFTVQIEKNIPKTEDLIAVELMLKKSPKLNKTTHSKRRASYSFEMESTKYPLFTFRINSRVSKLCDERILRIPADKIVTILITKKDYESKLAKKTEPDFWTKHHQYSIVEIYDLKYRQDHLF
ncbi:MAG: hypothetical protein AB8F94_14205, partial [Saprospiraceae bacterium]